MYKVGDKVIALIDDEYNFFFKKGQKFEVTYDSYAETEVVDVYGHLLYVNDPANYGWEYAKPKYFKKCNNKVVHKTEEDYYKWLASDRNYYE